MQKAFVTGACGFIGSALTRHLLQMGVAVRALCRDPRKGRRLAEAGAEVVAGDIQDGEGMARHAVGCEVVFHVAAVMGSAAYTYNINVQGTLRVAEAAHAAKAERFVHVSTIAVYGPNTSGLVRESHPHRPSPYDYYAQTKSIGELAAWAYANRVGLPMTCVRPAFVYGPESQFWTIQLYRLAKRGIAPVLDHGRAHAHPIYISDLCDLMAVMATHPDAPGHAFNAAPDPAPTWGEFLGYYMRMAGRNGLTPLPAAPLRLLAPLVTTITRLRGQPFDLGAYLTFMSHQATYSMAAARAVLGWSPRVRLADGMALTEQWIRQQEQETTTA